MKGGADQALVTPVDATAVPHEDLVDRLLVEQRPDLIVHGVATARPVTSPRARRPYVAGTSSRPTRSTLTSSAPARANATTSISSPRVPQLGITTDASSGEVPNPMG